MIGCEIDSIALFSSDIENRFNSPEEKFSKFRVFRIREYFILWFYAVFEINITETNFAPKKSRYDIAGNIRELPVSLGKLVFF